MMYYLLVAFKALTVILGVVTLVSAFAFTSKGLVSRKTIILTFACFVIFMVSSWITAILTDPSVAVPGLICMSGIITLIGITFAIKYHYLPKITEIIDKKTDKKE